MAEREPEGLSGLERIKQQSGYLRGRIAEDLAGAGDAVGKETAQLLKFHGTYQQDDRDARRAARAEGRSGKRYIFMVRSKIPGGVLTAEQLLAELDLCEAVGNGTLRITSRQGLQLHGVLKVSLAEAIARINQAGLTTLGACGDVNRNVMCCPAPLAAPMYARLRELARRLADHFAPRTAAYRELWLRDLETGQAELAATTEPADEAEPIYGPRYLPRKFKMGLALPHDNCIDVLTNDLAFLGVVEEDELLGFTVSVGGGLGVTPSAAKTFPALAKPLAFVEADPEAAVAVAEAVVAVQRDHGDRADRKTARLKYLIHRWGLERFRREVERRLGRPLAPPRAAAVLGHDDHMGWGRQGDGRWFYGLNVENGRIADREEGRLKAALREICARWSPGVRLTAHQSLLLTGLDEQARAALPEVLRRHGVRETERTSTVRRWSMACVAWPTCGLAITESERALPELMDRLEPELERLGLAGERFTIRMTGCPNGCARPYNADIGLVGRAKDRYTVFVGGRLLGDRLNYMYKDLVPRAALAGELARLFAAFAQGRREGESLGDFCVRLGRDRLLEAAGAAAAQ